MGVGGREGNRGKKKNKSPALLVLNPPVDNACLHRRPCNVFTQKSRSGCRFSPFCLLAKWEALRPQGSAFSPGRARLCSGSRFLAVSWMRPLTFALKAQEGLACEAQDGRR